MKPSQLICLVCSTVFALTAPAAAESTWAIQGGKTVIELDLLRLNAASIDVSLDGVNPLVAPEDGRLSLDLDVITSSDITLIEDGGLLVGATKGGLRHNRALVFHRRNLSVVIDRFQIEATGDSQTPEFFVRNGLEPIVVQLLDLSDARSLIDVGDATWRLAARDITIRPELAEQLGDPALAGLTVGSISTTADLIWTGGDEAGAPPPGDEPAPRGGTNCGGNPGPDVIVGALVGASGNTAQNYPSVQVQPGVYFDAFSIGTTSCNIGTQPLSWVDEGGSNAHPVIGQNFFRLANGRFEQLGQSWLKHGFFALQGTICCSCSPQNGNLALGVGCSDPYSASRNGGQGSAGPKWQVNPRTGVHIHPLANPSWSGGVARRLQIPVAELNEPGALYFHEGQYVTADDAAAGNQNNNASYRPVTITPSGNDRTFTLAGTTMREQPAIRAWKANDPAVTESDVQIANDGLIIVASKATDLGNGFFHYEYAVHNLNSERSIESFSVPLPAGVMVQNIGFRDVPYHSGDGEGNVNRDGTDWPATVATNSITWNMVDVGTNSNAIRWGTLYNFRFDTNSAPDDATATLGVFLPGTPSSVTAAVQGPVGGAGFLDCNGNEIDDAEELANGTSQDCNDNGTLDQCEVMCQLDSQLIASGLSSPVGIYAAPGDTSRLFIVEQTGRIKILNTATNFINGVPFLNLNGTISTGGERGLLGLAFDPDYDTNGHFYVNYTNLSGNTVIARYSVSADPDVADAGSAVTLKIINQDFANHNGGQLQFGPDGMLYCGMGDGGSGNDPNNRAQNTGSLLGKMLRLDVDNPPTYVPADNPYVGGGNPLDEIWALGLRNPWRFSFDRLTGDLWIADVGQDAQEEINFVPAGTGATRNFGWRCMEGTACTGLSGCTCNAGDLTLPIRTESHGDGSGTGSITGGYVYRGCAIPGLSGTYFYADYLGNYVRTFRLVDGVVTDLIDRTASLDFPSAIVSFGEDADGELYIVSATGQIRKIVCFDPNAGDCGNGVLEGAEECDPPDGVNCDCQCRNIGCDIPILSDDFQTDQGWTTSATNASAGHWQRGVPINDAGWDYDPIADSDGSGQCYLTQNTAGNSDVDVVGGQTDGQVTLTSPAFNGTAGGLIVRYDYYLNLTIADGLDALTVQISSNGDAGPWVEIARHDTSGGVTWRHNQVTEQQLLDAGVTPSANMKLRFIANDQNPQSVVEAAIDAVQICGSTPFVDCNLNCTDDAEDIAGAGSFDCNLNGTPDECEGDTAASYPIAVNPPLAIPDGTSVFAGTSFNVPVGGTIQDIDISVNIAHTWNGDVTARLSHNGTTVVLIDRPNWPETQFGFDNNGFDVLLDDEGAGGNIDTINSGGPAVTSPPSYQPASPLSAFDGIDMAGLWTLEASDGAQSDTGSITGWALHFTLGADPVDPCDCNGNGIADAIDLSSQTSLDCNSNGLPDECDIASGLEDDCDGGPVGNIADGQELFTVANACFGCHGPTGTGGTGPNIRNKSRVQIWNRLLSPTDHPGGAFDNFSQQDFADIEAYLADNGSRGRPDLIPDSCQSAQIQDCDGDDVSDGCELEAGSQDDLDYDGLPDGCTTGCPSPASGDFDGSGTTDGIDVQYFVDAVIGTPSQGDICIGDFNTDQTLDTDDITGMVGALLAE